MKKIATLTGIVILLVYFAIFVTNSVLKKIDKRERDIPTLLNFYYENKDSNPQRARDALKIILKQEPNNPEALHLLGIKKNVVQKKSLSSYLPTISNMESTSWEAMTKLGYLELQEKNHDAAISYFLKAFSIKEDPQIAVQLGYLYAQKKDQPKARYFFNYGRLHGDEKLKKQSEEALAFLEETVLQTQLQTNKILNPTIKPIILSAEEKLWASFYQNKTKYPYIALQQINALLGMRPNDIRVLKEAAYLATSQKQNERAIYLWKQVYSLEKNPEYALSIAYLYDALNNKPKAFHFFDLASKTTNMNIKNKAETGMTNIGPGRFKFLPDPYFIEFYATPFYFSRFDLGILPTITRAGFTINKKYSTDGYLSWRRTKDNKSGNIRDLIIQNSISQIFEDNVAIYAIGLRSNIWPTSPILAFLEIGEAEDLVYRFRPKWRGDIRGGLVYYNAWGEKPTWTPHLTFPFKWVATLYGDAIYYSRYDDNIIATMWFRPGLRVATFQSASLDFYMANYLVLDKNHEFYNNVYALGPGIAFKPSNRLNILLRLESLQAYYIPVNSPTPNPYGSKYYNNVAMLEFYFRF